MPRQFDNKLSPAEVERLALLAEECGEIIQVVGKILRHGIESVHPVTGESNRRLLEAEIGDMQCVLTMMRDAGDISQHEVKSQAADKAERIGRYLHHNKAPGSDDV